MAIREIVEVPDPRLRQISSPVEEVTPEIRELSCSDQLKEIIHRCIGERRKRYDNASELIEALRTPPPRLKAGVSTSALRLKARVWS